MNIELSYVDALPRRKNIPLARAQYAVPPHVDLIGLDYIELGVAENQVPLAEKFLDEHALFLHTEFEFEDTL